MQIPAAIGTVTNYKSRITIPGVCYSIVIISRASLTPSSSSLCSGSGYVAPAIFRSRGRHSGRVYEKKGERARKSVAIGNDRPPPLPVLASSRGAKYLMEITSSLTSSGRRNITTTTVASNTNTDVALD